MLAGCESHDRVERLGLNSAIGSEHGELAHWYGCKLLHHPPGWIRERRLDGVAPR
jgi:hypothetical protein